jgi:4-hydroxybenzoate polyprenyltransferase
MTVPHHSDDASDIRAGDWIDCHAPTALRPYFRLARIDRPIGTWLLLIPCWWGLALATVSILGPDPIISVWYALLFAVGSVVMRAAGCAWNDILDRDFDGRVARTAMRPIPSGAISVRQALAFMGLMALVGLAVLLAFNLFTMLLATASLVLVALYPLMKRITYWPQAFLGITFNWGILVGWAAVAGGLAAPALWLYAAAICWTIGYDTIYAHQDKDDDALIGLKSTALKFGTRTRPMLFLFYGLAVAFIAVSFWSANLNWPGYVFLLAAALHLGHQAATVKFDDAHNCLATFKSNTRTGLYVIAAIIAGGVSLG